MRTIKFKCWDGTKMWEHAVPLHSPAYNGGSINVSDYEDGSFNNFVNGELLQFTGLLDRNDKKIFEGDLVSVPWNHSKFVISFKDGCFVMDNVILTFYHKECKVIGNIYETPITS